MRTKSKLLTVAGIVFLSVVGLVVVLVVSFREPVYLGKPVSEWVEEFDGQGDAPAAKALVQIGEKSDPWLVRMLRSRDTPLKVKVVQWLTARPNVTHYFEKQAWFKVFMRPASVNQQAALNAVGALATEVRGTVPALAALVRDHPVSVSEPNAIQAVNVLAEMGPDGIPPLIDALTNRSAAVRLRAAQLLGTAPGSGTAEAATALQRCASGNDPATRAAAAEALQVIARRQAQAVPPDATNWAQTGGAAGAGSKDLWNVDQGIRLLSTSGVAGGYDWKAMFGADTSKLPRGYNGCTVFLDDQPDGTIHDLEWEMPSSVTISSFGLLNGSDGPIYSYQRSIRAFKLYARPDTNSPSFSLIYSEEVPVPSADGVFPNVISYFRNLSVPVTASQFRLEVVQNGGGSWHGPRVIRLMGFGGRLSQGMMEAVIQTFDTNTQQILRIDFRDQLVKSK